jgi:hypothetical protein
VTDQTWVTIPDAAILANRSPRTIYSWIDRGLLATRTNDSGQTVVQGTKVLALEPTIRRGRRRGSARPRHAA